VQAAPYPTYLQAWWLPRVPPEVTFTLTGMPPPRQEGDRELTAEEEEEEEEEWKTSTKWPVYPSETWGWLETELAVARAEGPAVVQIVRRSCRPLRNADAPVVMPPLRAQPAA
jgi:hypothetical protein